jgi:hypothetical protein
MQAALNRYYCELILRRHHAGSDNIINHLGFQQFRAHAFIRMAGCARRFSLRICGFSDPFCGWLGARIRTWECRKQNPAPYQLATPTAESAVGRADHWDGGSIIGPLAGGTGRDQPAAGGLTGGQRHGFDRIAGILSLRVRSYATHLFVLEIGCAAIDLYSGRLALSQEEIRAAQ